MNSFIFNSTADQLKASLYAKNSATVSAMPLQVDSEGALYVTSHAPLTICGSITINAPLTVGSLSVSGTITVANPITIANQCLTVSLAGRYNYVEEDYAYNYSSGSEEIQYRLYSDISSISTATLFLFNNSPGTATVSVQLNPWPNYWTDDYWYIDDPNYTNVPLQPNERKIMPLGIMARSFRLKCYLAPNTQINAFLCKQV